MKRKKYSESQIVQILKEAEAGVPVTELSRKYGVPHTTMVAWRPMHCKHISGWHMRPHRLMWGITMAIRCSSSRVSLFQISAKNKNESLEGKAIQCCSPCSFVLLFFSQAFLSLISREELLATRSR